MGGGGGKLFRSQRPGHADANRPKLGPEALPAIGRRTLIEGPAVPPLREIGKQTAVEAAEAAVSPFHVTAARGGEGHGEALPHAEQIQRSFGRFDVSHLRAHVDGLAADASRALGGRAYAYGQHLAFVEVPDLHTAAHEAAHALQQQAGVTLARGIDEPGDWYEQHANAVADLVVRG